MSSSNKSLVSAKPLVFIIGFKSLTIGKGDVFIFQTDGLMDTVNNDDIPFDYFTTQKRFMDEIRPGLVSRQILDGIIEKAALHKGTEKPYDDDVTIGVVKIN